MELRLCTGPSCDTRIAARQRPKQDSFACERHSGDVRDLDSLMTPWWSGGSWIVGDGGDEG